ncbi:MAG: phosphatidate cytidylyltransferase [Candidatus Sericytochromatia bacterium]|nr:phosphatidate cytidylyltransferase [Candidatus Sericytochromatia bacterium]
MTDTDLALRFLSTLAAFVAGGAGTILLARLVSHRKLARATSGAGEAAPAAAPAAVRTPFWLRLGTLLALAVAVFVPAFLGAWAWACAVGVLVGLGLGEFWRMLAAAGAPAHPVVGLAAGLLLPIAAAVGGVSWLTPTLALGFALVAATALFARQEAPLPGRLGATWLGVCYVGLQGAFLVLIQQTGDQGLARFGAGGFGALVFFLMVVQLADVGGLLGGVLFGRHKLVPRLSPGKTWEGLAGSVLVAVLGAWAFAFALPGVPLPWLLAGAVVLALAGLVGDLLASGFKRAAGLKDFGTLLPGHGGVLDRFDGYLFTAPLCWAGLQLWLLLGR